MLVDPGQQHEVEVVVALLRAEREVEERQVDHLLPADVEPLDQLGAVVADGAHEHVVPAGVRGRGQGAGSQVTRGGVTVGGRRHWCPQLTGLEGSVVAGVGTGTGDETALRDSANENSVCSLERGYNEKSSKHAHE